MRRYQDGVKYSSVLRLFTDKPNFRFRFYVAKLRGNLLLSIFLGNCFTFNFFGAPAFLKDRLNFDGRPLKIIGFWKHCFDKFYALLT